MLHISSTVPAPTEPYTLSLHDALPIFGQSGAVPKDYPLTTERYVEDLAQLIRHVAKGPVHVVGGKSGGISVDRKSTRLNSSHSQISYAVFCLKKKSNKTRCVVRRDLSG